MMASASAIPSRYGDFVPLPRRIAVLTGVALLHFSLFALLFVGLRTGGVLRGQSQRAGRSLTLVNIAEGEVTAAAGGVGGAASPQDSGGDLASRPEDVLRRASPGGGEDAGAAALSAAVRAALSDDPVAAAGRAEYQHILWAHIARFRRGPDAGAERLRFGTAVIRVNVDRQGGIIDVRVVKSQGSSLDEAALAALWRAEPLPAVPIELAVPLSVDVPIEFVRG